MSSYVTIAPDGSRDVDVQSLFYDQIGMVQRIARMEQKRECTQCPHVVGDSFERDCAFPDCIGGWRAAYDLLHSAHQKEEHAAQQRIAELKAERDRLREALSYQKIEIVHLKRVLRGICSNYEIPAPKQSAAC